MRIKKKVIKSVIGSIVVDIQEDGHCYRCTKTGNLLTFIPPDKDGDDEVGCIMLTDITSHNYIEIYYDNEENREVVEVLYNDRDTTIEFNGRLYSVVDDTHFSVIKK